MSISHLSLFKRSNDFWYILYTEAGRRRWKSTGETLKSQALKRLTEFEKLLQSKPKPKTLSVFTLEFLAYAKTVYAKPTCDIFRMGLGHLRSISGDCTLSELSPEDIDRYKAMRVSDVSPVTVNVELRSLRAVMNVAHRWDLVRKNPFVRVQLVPVPHSPPAFLSKDEFEKLLAVIPERWLRDMVTLAVLSGMSRAELCHLHWTDVDLGRRVIHIQSNGAFRTKHGRSRTIPFGEMASHLLELMHRKSVAVFVFTSGGKRISEDWITHAFKKYVRLAGLNDKLHFHSLRHTFASWLVQDGVSLYEVQKLLGHSNISVTQVYSHLQPEKLHSPVNRINITMN